MFSRNSAIRRVLVVIGLMALVALPAFMMACRSGGSTTSPTPSLTPTPTLSPTPTSTPSPTPTQIPTPTPTVTPTPTPSTSPTPTGGPTAVKITSFAFDPANITVTVGTTVTWTNLDSVSHTVTSDTGVFESGTLSHNATFSYTFNSRGTFNYFCSLHPSMKGKVVVE